VNYLTKQQVTNAKAGLTRAKKSGDPQRVIDFVDSLFAEWDDGGYAYPDNWHLWNIARDDAYVALRYG
jgi:hypothetical protein